MTNITLPREVLEQAAQALIDFHDGPVGGKRPDIFHRRMENLRAALAAQQEPGKMDCWCETCRPITLGKDMRMVLCPDCGNKRCPKATNHTNACTGSNAIGQPGSSWEHVKPPATAGTVPVGEAQKWKSGNEFLPFHPQASHVNPDYRDGWNACFKAAQPAAAPQPQQAAPIPNKKYHAGDGLIFNGEKWLEVAPGMETFAMLNMAKGFSIEGQQAAPVAVMEGWQLVPVEPTREMESSFYPSILKHGKRNMYPVWKDLLQAAPNPQGE